MNVIVAPQFIRDYLTKNFGTVGRISANGEEFIMESIFIENDWKRHLSINIFSGLWQCFKSGRSGNFIKFYAEAENKPYFKAQKELIIKNFQFLGEEIPETFSTPNKLDADTEDLIPITIESGHSSRMKVQQAWSFLFGRRLLVEEEGVEPDFFLAKSGPFEGRLIVPFKDSDGIVYYFQARTLENHRQKYLNPPTDIAPKSSDILFPYDEDAEELVVCEGPLDAWAMKRQGINATSTQGCVISDRQADILSSFKGKLILGFDNDEAGLKGITRFEKTRKRLRMPEFYICSPPPNMKDWGEAHAYHVSLRAYLERETVLFDYYYKNLMALSSLK